MNDDMKYNKNEEDEYQSDDAAVLRQRRRSSNPKEEEAGGGGVRVRPSYIYSTTEERFRRRPSGGEFP